VNGQIGSHPRGIAGNAANDPERIALIDGARRITFGELDALANGLATTLRGRVSARATPSVSSCTTGPSGS
jgi:non-ribosomal peptide synthetase component E (peptide arylation enzyme)